MPDMTPVANQVIPPDPTKGINTFSGILGLKQQQQALQLGQQKLAVGQTEVQQSQQKNTELQNLSLFTQGAIKSGKYQLPDGSSDVQAFTKDAMGIAPTYGQEFIGRAASNFKEATESRRSLQQLSGEQNKQISDALKGIATKPDATPSDLLDAVSQIRSNNKDPGFNRALDNFLLGASRTSPQQAAANASSALGGLSQSAPAEMDIGGQIATGTRGTMGQGMGAFNPTGQVIQKTLNPAQTPGYLAQAATASGGAAGQVSNDAQVFGQIMQKSATAQRGIDLANKVRDLARQARTGKYSQEFADQLTVLKQHDPNATDRQLLEKYAENLKTTVEQGASTDAERNQRGAGFPTPKTMGPDALEKAAGYASGLFRLDAERGANAQRHVQGNGVQGLTIADNEFMKNKNPSMYAPSGGKTVSEADVTAYAQKHGLTPAVARAHVLKNGFTIQ
jgi:hypothetical protein